MGMGVLPDIDIDFDQLNWYANKSRPGWFCILGSKEAIKAVRQSGVQQDPMASGPNMIVVPAWVVDAIKTYRSGGGYGDMDLGEFLKRVGGDFKAKK